MTLLRPILMLLVVAGACGLTWKFAEHHPATNDQAFMALYMHLMPAKLVAGQAGDHAESDAGEGSEARSHGEPGEGEHAGGAHEGAPPLVALPLPGVFGFFDGDPRHDGAQLVMTNLQLFQIAAVLLVFIAFSGVPSYLRSGRGDALTRTLAGFCVAIRDEMVYAKMGKDLGARFLPLFLSIFWFVLFMNLLGLVPGAATATASPYVTAALALVTLLTMLGCGMSVQGPLAYWKNLVPHVPAWLWPLMFLVEVIGVLVKPFALLIRLFANMTGGHMVVLSFMGLIFFFAGNDFSALKSLSIAPVAVGFAVFIMIIEGFVAVLQAYIFTQLSILFVNMSIHPGH